MYCVKCGQRLADGAAYCPACGEPVGVPQAEETGSAGYDGDAGAQAPGAGEWGYVNTSETGSGIYDRNDSAMNERLRRDSEARRPKGRSVASLVLGIISLVLVWVPVIPVVLGLIGLLLGLSARRKGERGLSTAGITLCVLGLVFGAIISLMWILLILEVAGVITGLGLGNLARSFNDINIDLPIGKNIRFTVDLPGLVRRLLAYLI